MNRILLIFLVVLIAIGGIWLVMRSGDQTGKNSEETAGYQQSMQQSGGDTNQNNPSLYDSIAIALLDTEGTTNGPQRGCDKVVMVQEQVTPTTAPLTAALTTLFSLDSVRVTDNNWYNFMAKTNGTLHFDHATVDGGTANIYLTGELSGLAGVCDDPRAKTQIEETALQFRAVNTVQIYLNGQPTDLTPNEKGTEQ